MSGYNNSICAGYHGFIMTLHCRKCSKISTVELGYKMMKGAECFASLQMSVVLAEKHNVPVNSEKLIGTAEYLILETRCHIN
jgi:hypothetical protein